MTNSGLPFTKPLSTDAWPSEPSTSGAAGDERASHSHAPYEPAITVATRRGNGQVATRLVDNGLGIRDAVKAKIFEPFFTTTTAGSETGLGLSLRYDIITQRHGGTLTVATEEGSGATFIVTQPVPEARSSAAA